MAFLSNLLAPTRRLLEEDRLFGIKAILISAILIFSAYFAPRIADGNRRYALILLLYLGVLGLLVLTRWPALGFAFVILGGFFTQYEGPGGFNLALIGIAFMLVVWVLDMVIKKRRIQLVVSRTIKPVLFFVIISILSYGLGQLPWYSFARNAPVDAQTGGLAIFLLSAGAFLAMAHLVHEQIWLERLTWLFIILGGLFIAGQYLGGYGGYITHWYHQNAVSGSMFWTWLVALAFGQALINNRLHIGWRLALWGLVALTMYYAFFINSGWKSGYLPPIAAIGAIIGIRYWRFTRYGLVFLVIPVWILAMQAISTDQYSYSTRLDAWLVVVEIAKASPILGLGFANYYWYAPLFPIRGYYIRFNSHSQYVDLFAQTGILGLIGYFWFFWEVTRLGLWLRERVPEGFAKGYVYGALGGIAGTIIAGLLVDWVLPFVYNIGMNGFRASVLPWIFLGGLVSIEQMLRKEAQPGV